MLGLKKTDGLYKLGHLVFIRPSGGERESVDQTEMGRKSVRQCAGGSGVGETM